MKRIIIGNWKMNPASLKEAQKWLKEINRLLPPLKKTEVVIAAPFVYLENLKNMSKKVLLGAGDAFPGEVGPFTGQVSAEMLYSIGVRHVILGHSERRALGETDEMVNRKIKSVLEAGLTPIVCIGERERDQDHGYFNIVKNQIAAVLAGVAKASFPKIIFAYEPVWAISSTANRRDATAADSREMAVFIRKTLSDLSTPEIAASIRIIYGGSANEKDAAEFLTHGGVVGLLPGKASLSPKQFSEMVKICEALKN